jgi:hypothetical protein
MTKAAIAGGTLAIALVVVLAFIANDRALEHTEEPAAVTSPAEILPAAEAASEAHQGFIFGRVTTDDGAIYEGRLRFGAARRRSGVTISMA